MTHFTMYKFKRILYSQIYYWNVIHNMVVASDWLIFGSSVTSRGHRTFSLVIGLGRMNNFVS